MQHLLSLSISIPLLLFSLFSNHSLVLRVKSTRRQNLSVNGFVATQRARQKKETEGEREGERKGGRTGNCLQGIACIYRVIKPFQNSSLDIAINFEMWKFELDSVP